MDQSEYENIFNLPFAEASQFFRDKLNIPTAAWDDLWHAQQAKGFMTAGAMKADLLNDFRAAVQKAIDGGTTLKEFQEQFDVIVARHGWSYNGSRNWRSALIYNTNVRTSYQAGRWKQLTDPATKAPYLVYRHRVGVLHPRPLHVSWNGLTLPSDHVFWKTHYPPNGWRCHCTVFAASATDRQAAISKGKGEPASGWDAADAKTGAPIGIDKGWDYNVGQAAERDYSVLRDKIAGLPKDFANKLAAEMTARGIETT